MELNILLWLFAASLTAIVGGVAWMLFKKALFGSKGSGLPPNGSAKDEEEWLTAMRSRITKLEENQEMDHNDLANLRESMFKLQRRRLRGE